MRYRGIVQDEGPMGQDRRNLVIVRAGPASLHPRWLTGRRDFDLLIARYSPAAPASDADGVTTIDVPGAKIAGYGRLFRERPDLFDRYDRIALIDDDIDTDATALSTAFELGRRYDLRLWQPSLTLDSHFSYAGTLSQQGAFLLRYVTFVEMMCPFFSASHLAQIAWLFDEGFETGIDLLWHRTSTPAWFGMAILDAVAVRHGRPVGRDKGANGFGEHERYDDQMSEVLRRYDGKFRGLIGYAGLSTDGRRLLCGRVTMAIKAAGLLRAHATTPLAPRRFLRLVGDHVRHCAYRSADLAADPLSRCESV